MTYIAGIIPCLPARPRSLPRGDRDRLAGRMNAKSSSQQQSRCFELKSQLAVDTVNLTYYYYCNKKRSMSCERGRPSLPHLRQVNR